MSWKDKKCYSILIIFGHHEGKYIENFKEHQDIVLSQETGF